MQSTDVQSVFASPLQNRDARWQRKNDKKKAMAEANAPARAVVPEGPKEPESLPRRVAGILNGMFLQSILYLVFVYVFQSLTGCFRMPQEFMLDKHVMDRIVENHFDSSHNTFETVRRVADIYEWGNTVLLP